jgi:hypothetical protein
MYGSTVQPFIPFSAFGPFLRRRTHRRNAGTHGFWIVRRHDALLLHAQHDSSLVNESPRSCCPSMSGVAACQTTKTCREFTSLADTDRPLMITPVSQVHSPQSAVQTSPRTTLALATIPTATSHVFSRPSHLVCPS